MSARLHVSLPPATKTRVKTFLICKNYGKQENIQIHDLYVSVNSYFLTFISIKDSLTVFISKSNLLLYNSHSRWQFVVIPTLVISFQF